MRASRFYRSALARAIGDFRRSPTAEGKMMCVRTIIVDGGKGMGGGGLREKGGGRWRGAVEVSQAGGAASLPLEVCAGDRCARRETFA